MKRIKTNEEYLKALSRFEEIFNADEDSKEGEESFLLGLLIGSYEEDHFPIDDPDPIDYIDARLDALGLKRQDLDGVIAKGTSHVSEVMNKKRPLSLDAIRALEDKFNMDPKILIQRYKLDTSSAPLNRKAIVRSGTIVKEPKIAYKSKSPRDNKVKTAKDRHVRPSKEQLENPNVKRESSDRETNSTRTKSSQSKKH